MTRHHSPHVLELGKNVGTLLDRPFQNMSQGEQKMALIYAVLAGRAEFLVLDEPCQGLDLWYRRRGFKLVEQLCRATPSTLV